MASCLLQTILFICMAFYFSSADTVFVKDNFLVTADSGSGVYNIHQVSILNPDKPHTILPQTTYAIAVTYDEVEQQVYWSDVILNLIARTFLNGTYQIIKRLGEDATPDGIAFDPIDRLLYYTDTGLDIIAVMRPDGSAHRILVETGTDQPRGIALDPVNGWMYWTDWGSNAKIERAHMDGSNRTVIVNTNLSLPNDIAIDHQVRKLYWVDAGTDNIERSNLDGSGREVFLHHEGHFFGIAISQAFTYFTDWTNGSWIYSVSKSDPDTVTQFASTNYSYSRLNGIFYYKEGDNQIEGETACSSNNGGCRLLCIPVPGGRSCACPDGHSLQPDGVSCDMPEDEFLLITDRRNNLNNRSRIMKMDLETMTMREIPLNQHDNPVAVSYDPVEDYLYWSDVGTSVKQIRKAKLDGTNEETVVQLSQSAVCDGIAVEPSFRLLYYTELQEHYVAVMNLDSNDQRVLVSRNLEKPRAIALYAEKGIMFWTDWGNESKIERADMDGNSRRLITNINLVWPNGLTIDKIEQKLYWCDANNDRIEFSNLEGQFRQVLHETTSGNPHFFGLALGSNYLYVTDWTDQQIFKTVKNRAGQLKSFGPAFPGTPSGIHHYKKDSAIQANVCDRSNGFNGCSHLCLPTSSGAVCACPTGYILEFDGKTCNSLACPINIPYGAISTTDNCRRRVGQTCAVRCNEGYHTPYQNFTVTCLANARWNIEVDQICTEYITTESPSTSVETTAMETTTMETTAMETTTMETTAMETTTMEATTMETTAMETTTMETTTIETTAMETTTMETTTMETTAMETTTMETTTIESTTMETTIMKTTMKTSSTTPKGTAPSIVDANDNSAKVSMTFTDIAYDDSYKDTTSNSYRDLVEKIKAVLLPSLSNLERFKSVTNFVFSPGSVVANFDVIMESRADATVVNAIKDIVMDSDFSVVNLQLDKESVSVTLFQIDPNNNNEELPLAVTIAIACAGGVIIIVLVTVAVCCLKRRKEIRRKSTQSRAEIVANMESPGMSDEYPLQDQGQNVQPEYATIGPQSGLVVRAKQIENDDYEQPVQQQAYAPEHMYQKMQHPPPLSNRQLTEARGRDIREEFSSPGRYYGPLQTPFSNIPGRQGTKEYMQEISNPVFQMTEGDRGMGNRGANMLFGSTVEYNNQPWNLSATGGQYQSLQPRPQ